VREGRGGVGSELIGGVRASLQTACEVYAGPAVGDAAVVGEGEIFHVGGEDVDAERVTQGRTEHFELALVDGTSCWVGSLFCKVRPPLCRFVRADPLLEPGAHSIRDGPAELGGQAVQVAPTDLLGGDQIVGVRVWCRRVDGRLVLVEHDGPPVVTATAVVQHRPLLPPSRCWRSQPLDDRAARSVTACG